MTSKNMNSLLLQRFEIYVTRNRDALTACKPMLSATQLEALQSELDLLEAVLETLKGIVE